MPRQSKRCAKAAPYEVDNAVTVRSRVALPAQVDRNVSLRVAKSVLHPVLRVTFVRRAGRDAIYLRADTNPVSPALYPAIALPGWTARSPSKPIPETLRTRHRRGACRRCGCSVFPCPGDVEAVAICHVFAHPLQVHAHDSRFANHSHSARSISRMAGIRIGCRC